MFKTEYTLKEIQNILQEWNDKIEKIADEETDEMMRNHYEGELSAINLLAYEFGVMLRYEQDIEDDMTVH